MKTLAMCMLLVLAACSNSRRLPMPSGEVFQLNPDRWTATQAELRLARESMK